MVHAVSYVVSKSDNPSRLLSLAAQSLSHVCGLLCCFSTELCSKIESDKSPKLSQRQFIM